MECVKPHIFCLAPAPIQPEEESSLRGAADRVHAEVEEEHVVYPGAGVHVGQAPRDHCREDRPCVAAYLRHLLHRVQEGIHLFKALENK